MASKKSAQFEMTKVVTRVRLATDPSLAPSGDGPYKTDDLADGDIEVFGTQFFEWSDGSGVACFIVPNKNFVLSPRAMRNFAIVDWKDE